MKNLLFISLLVLFLTSCSSFIYKSIPAEKITGHISGFSLYDTANVKRFKARIIYKTTELSGILICKKLTDSTSAGSFINEFGIKGFDFTISGRKALLGYTFNKLDKWYIRKSLEKDLQFMFFRPKLNNKGYVKDSLAFVAPVGNKLTFIYFLSSGNRIEYADRYKGSRKTASMHEYFDEMNMKVLKMEHIKGAMKYEFYEILKGKGE